MNINSQLTVVTVTYGNRWHLLQRVLREVRAQGVREVVVVDNAATLPIQDLMAEFGGFVKVVHLPHNSGSAVGFKTGIAHALDAGAEYVLMLDDDNVPAPGSLAILGQTLTGVLAQSQSGLAAVLGNRSNSDANQNLAEKSVWLRPGSFLGFHVSDIPAKIMRRLGRNLHKPDLPVPAGTVEVGVCTYGGLMFHRSLIDKIGPPREDFILYMDDYEWTYRITSQGGSILLVVDAGIRDLELQWNAGARFSNSFEGWLLGEGDLRAYYTARNRIYFEKNLQPNVSWLRRVNKRIYLTALRFFAWRTRRQARFRLLLRAVSDGESGRMGMNKEFLL